MHGLTELQSPVNGEDYEGLQVDTRAKDSTDKHLDTQYGPQGLRSWETLDDKHDYLHEKQIALVDETLKGDHSPTSPGATLVEDAETPRPKTIDDGISVEPGSPPAPNVRKICGMRRRNFWIAFGAVLVIVVVAAIVGGLVGGKRKKTVNSSMAPGGSLPPASAIAPPA